MTLAQMEQSAGGIYEGNPRFPLSYQVGLGCPGETSARPGLYLPDDHRRCCVAVLELAIRHAAQHLADK